MHGSSIKTILRKSKNTLKESFFGKRSNWESISKPLTEDPRNFFGIHDPTIEEYRMIRKSADGTTKTAYDWWYSAIVQDKRKRPYFLICAFHPNWSFYRIVSIDNENSRSSPNIPKTVLAIGKDFRSSINYKDNEDTIEISVTETKVQQLSKESLSCVIRSGRSALTLRTEGGMAELSFSSLGPAFWINRGREAVCTPRGDKMHGFYDISHVEGFIVQEGLRIDLSGVGANEHLISFAPLEHFWRRIDGVFICTPQIYCTFIYLENEIGSKRYEYKDGAVIFRASKEYLIPVDFKIQYLEFDGEKKVPTKIHIVAQTEKGELNAVLQAMGEIEKQLALRLIEGQFVFNNGETLELTNGYGQHALH